MITDINSEDRLVQKTFADYLHDNLGWESVYAWNEETFGLNGMLGRIGEREAVLVRDLRAAIAKLNPDLPEKARQVKRSQARRTLVLQYLENAVAVDREMIRKVFHVLDWTPSELDRTVAELCQEGVVRKVRVEGLDRVQFFATRALELPS